MNLSWFIVRKIAFSQQGSLSAFVVRIAIAAITLSVATMIITTSMVNGFQKEIRNKVLSFWSHMEIVPYSLTNSLSEEGVYRYQKFYTDPTVLPEVKHIQVSAMKGGLLKTNDDIEGIVLRGVGDDFDWSNFRMQLLSGDTIHTGEPEPDNHILISTETSRRLHLKIGDKVVISFMEKRVRNRPFKVGGIYETGLEEFDRRYAMVDIRQIQELNGWGKDTVGGFEVFLKEENLFKNRWRSYFLTLFGALLSEEHFQELNKDPLETLSEDVYFRLDNPKLDVISIKDLTPGIFDWLDLQTMNELIILFLMIVVAVINMITTLLILILERTNMIGVFKALGGSNSMVRRIFLNYSLVIVGAGLLLGNFIGIGFCLLQSHFHIISLPKESYYLSYAPILINWGWILALNAGTVVITVVILLIPATMISKIVPVKALRFE